GECRADGPLRRASCSTAPGPHPFPPPRKRFAETGVEDRCGMLQLAVEADERGLAVALRVAGRDAERLDAGGAEDAAEFLADRHQLLEILDAAAGTGILDRRNGGGAARRRALLAAHLGPDLLHDCHELSDPGPRHATPPWLTAREPARPTLRPCPSRTRKAARISPRARSDSALTAPRSRAVATSSGRSGPTPTVTKRSPRSLSGASSRAGRRSIWRAPGRSTALATMVAAASASAAVAARIVTASAMPSEWLRPRQPLVAMPPMRSAAESSITPANRPKWQWSWIPTRQCSSPRRCSAMSPPLLTTARESPAAPMIAARM